MEKKLEVKPKYFRDVDAAICHELDYFLCDAEQDELDEITILEAIPDNDNTDFVWCTQYGECVQISDCKKSICPEYSSKSGRGRCSNKGNLYLHGDPITFKTNPKR